MTGVSEAEVRKLFPTTDENPKEVEIPSWYKLDTDMYMIRLSEDIATMSKYKLVKETTDANPKELKITLWQKLDTQMYRIGLNNHITTMNEYKLVRTD